MCEQGPCVKNHPSLHPGGPEHLSGVAVDQVGPLQLVWQGLRGHAGEVWLKLEGANPTGSFKDRGMTMAITKAVEEGSKAVICASTGNTSASLASYAAAANIPALVLIPEGKISGGKLAQTIAHGALVVHTCRPDKRFTPADGEVHSTTMTPRDDIPVRQRPSESRGWSNTTCGVLDFSLLCCRENRWGLLDLRVVTAE